MTGRDRRLARLESRLYRAEAYEQRCTGVRIPWDTRSKYRDKIKFISFPQEGKN